MNGLISSATTQGTVLRHLSLKFAREGGGRSEQGDKDLLTGPP